MTYPYLPAILYSGFTYEMPYQILPLPPARGVSKVGEMYYQVTPCSPSALEGVPCPVFRFVIIVYILEVLSYGSRVRPCVARDHAWESVKDVGKLPHRFHCCQHSHRIVPLSTINATVIAATTIVPQYPKPPKP